MPKKQGKSTGAKAVSKMLMKFTPAAGNFTNPLAQSANEPVYSLWCKNMLFSFTNKTVPNSASA